MLKNFIFFAFAAAVAVGIGYADQSQPVAKVVVPVGKASPASGKQMFATYCAPCHGVDGKGNGPMASSLVQRPADLSVLSKSNGGKFPATHVIGVLQFGVRNPAHGTAEMPIWGPLFSQMNPPTPQADLSTLSASNLTRYIQSLQLK